MNLKLTKGVPVDLYAATLIPIGTLISVHNMGGAPITLSTTLSGLSMSASGDCRECGPGDTAFNDSGDQGAFVVSNSCSLYINVRKEA